ncbi:MAG: hypothetical protein U0414_23965 [Polyangiaceae bacterium]
MRRRPLHGLVLLPAIAAACASRGPSGPVDPEAGRDPSSTPTAPQDGPSCGPLTNTLRAARDQMQGLVELGTAEPPDVGPVTSVAGGEAALCGLAKNGAVVCWNDGARFIGVRAVSDERIPEPRVRRIVETGTADVVEIGVGARHACARLRSGEIRCWSDQASSSIGTAVFSRSHEPSREELLLTYPVASIDDATDLSVDGDHACAIRKGGAVWCWGSSYYGESGSSDESVFQPIPVEGVPPAEDVVVGERIGCARTHDGQVWCWGSHDDVERDPKPRRVDVPSASVVLADGQLGCALDAGRTKLRCWGPSWPLEMDGEEGITELALPKKPLTLALDDHGLCAAWEDGTVSCRGGVGESLAGREHPGWVDVPAFSGTRSLAMGDGAVCAVGSDGGVQCFGDRHKLGRPSLDGAGPTDVVGVADARALVVGDSTGCVMDDDHAIRCWGADVTGSPAQGLFSPLTGRADAFAFGRLETCALDAGKVRCAEAPKLEQPIDTKGSAVELAGSVRSLSVGWGHTCASTEDGAAWCWGANGTAQIDGVPDPSGKAVETPRRVGGVAAATTIAAGGCSTCAIVTGGEVVCWGCNGKGELGNGSYLEFGEPSPVIGVRGAVGITVGSAFACARSERGVRCWGADARASVGWPGTEGARDVAAGDGEACVVLADGSVICGVPGCAATIEGIHDATAIGVGSRRACALRAGGRVSCWGERRNGALGDGELDFVREPVRVLPRPSR